MDQLLRTACVGSVFRVYGGKLRKELWKFLATRGHISGKYERPQHTSINRLEEPALVPCFDELPSLSAGFNVNDAVCALDLWAL